MKSDLIIFLIRIKCGLEAPGALKKCVNTLIDDGQWSEGFDLAVSSQPLDRHQNDELCDILIRYLGLNSLHLDKTIKEISEISRHCSRIEIAVSNDQVVVISDYTHLYKIENGTLAWETDRISIDGIRGLRIAGEQVLGQWFSPIDDHWHDFSVDLKTGHALGACGWT